MKKNIFYWAFLVLAGMGLTACSSGDDNIADNTTPVTPGSQNKTVILTGTIGVGGDEATRAVDDDGKTSWKANDPITINYETALGGYSRANGTIKQVSSDNHFATFEATLENPKNDGFIGFAYGTVESATPSPSSAYDFTFNYDAYSTQYGTTAAITTNRLDYACTEEGGEVKMAVDGNKATLKSTALLKNQFSMFEFTLKTDEATPQYAPATKLQIFIKSSGSFPAKADYTVTPTAATSKFYVALIPTDDEATIEGVKIVASFDGKDPAIKLNTDAKVNAITSTDYGKFLCVDETVNKTTHEKDHQAYLCATKSSAYFCEHTYSTSKFVKGKLYTKELEVKKLTPTAVIAYTGEVANYCDNFIALALSDATTSRNTVSLSDGQGLITTWLGNNTLKMGDTDKASSTYSTLQGTGGKYDVVRANPQKSTTPHYFYEDNPNSIVPSQKTDISLSKGWRLPTVTDLRYIFSQLKDGSGNPVITGITPTNPAGIMDHNGVYRYYTGTWNTGTWTSPYGSSSGYYVPSTNSDPKLWEYLKDLCNNDDTNCIDAQYYWLGSGAILEDGTTNEYKCWRFNFDGDKFGWYDATPPAGDNALIRLVLAY